MDRLSVAASRWRLSSLFGPRQAPAPHDSVRKASLLSLPTDVLSRITDLLQSTSPRSLAQLSLVSRRLRSVAQYSQHYHVTFDLSQAGEDGLFQHCKLIESAGLELAVREVTILQCHLNPQRKEERYRRRVETLCRTVEKLTALRTLFHLDWTIPNNILAALPPQASIHTLYTGQRELEDQSLDGLCGNVNLTLLDVRVTWYNEKECKSIMEGLKEVLLKCPNVRILKLDVSQPTSGCCLFMPPDEDVGLGFKNGERPPPLQQLDLIGYHFGRGEVEYWANHFDWSKLRRLKTGHGEFAIKAAKHFTALEEVELLEDWRTPDWSEFFQDVPSRLRSITIPWLDKVSLDGLLCHSNSLEGLHLHRQEDYQGTWRSQCLTPDTIELIATQCPHVRRLSLDIARSGDWPYSTFDALAAFTHLEDLTIWFELGVADSEHPVEPFVTFDTSRHIYEHLHDRCKSLQTFHLHTGSPPDIGFGFPSPEAFWPMYNITCFDVEASERDDECSCVVTCAELERHEKSVRHAEKSAAMERTPAGEMILGGLQRVLKPERYRRRRAAEFWISGVGQATRRRDEAFVVAHGGPRPLSKWNSHY